MVDVPVLEQHFNNSEIIRDVVIGMADGLTVPFALAAGISGAVDSINIIVVAGLAEIAAGAIAMGLGAYLAARTYEEHYRNEKNRELYEIDFLTERERQETREIFSYYGLQQEIVEAVVKDLEKNKNKWAEFMMRFELGMEEPHAKRAPISALTIGSSYIVGGFIPLSSYMILDDIRQALFASIILTLITLGVFGAIKGKFTGINPIKAAIQTILVGGTAAAVAFGIAKMISS